MKTIRQRPARIVPATIVSILILALGVALGWAGINKLSTGQWWPQLEDGVSSASTAAWDSPWGWGAAIAAAVVGLILLITAWTPGSFNRAKIQPAAPEQEGVARSVDAVITHKGMATLASAAAAQVDGVSSVSTSAAGSSVFVRVDTPLRETEGLVNDVTLAVQDRLKTVGLTQAPKVRVRANTKDKS